MVPTKKSPAIAWANFVCFSRKQDKKKGWQRLTLPPKAVPSALRGLTSLFGMGRGDPPRFNHQHFFVVHFGAQLILFSLIAFNQCYNLLTIGK